MTVVWALYKKCVLCHINRWKQTKRPLESADVFGKKTTCSLWKSTSDVGCAEWATIWSWYRGRRLQGKWLTTNSSSASATETAHLWASASRETQNKSSSSRCDRVVRAWRWQSFTACTGRTSQHTRYGMSAVIPLYNSVGVNSFLMVWRVLNILCCCKCHCNRGVCSLWGSSWYQNIWLYRWVVMPIDVVVTVFDHIYL